MYTNILQQVSPIPICKGLDKKIVFQSRLLQSSHNKNLTFQLRENNLLGISSGRTRAQTDGGLQHPHHHHRLLLDGVCDGDHWEHLSVQCDHPQLPPPHSDELLPRLTGLR